MRSKCYLQGKKADGVRKIDRKKAPKSQLMWSQRSDSFFCSTGFCERKFGENSACLIAITWTITAFSFNSLLR